jgi:hypothetical protein
MLMLTPANIQQLFARCKFHYAKIPEVVGGTARKFEKVRAKITRIQKKALPLLK